MGLNALLVLGLLGFGSCLKAQETWIPSGPASLMSSVAYGQISGADLFVAVGSNSPWAVSNPSKAAILTSADGVSWTNRAQALGSVSQLNKVVYAAGHFVVVGGSSTTDGVILYSTDGVDWHTANGLPGSFEGLATVCRGSVNGTGVFVAAGGATVATSTDGENWTVTPEALRSLYSHPYYNEYVLDIVYASVTGHDMFVAVGGRSGQDGFALFAHDLADVAALRNAASWGAEYNLSNQIITGVAYGPGKFVATGYPVSGSSDPSDVYSRIWTVTDSDLLTNGSSATWTRQNSVTNSLSDVIYANSQFTAVGGILGGSVVLTSPDATTWTPQTLPTVALNGGLSEIAYGAVGGSGLYVTAGFNGPAIMTSPNSSTWTVRRSSTTTTFNGVAYGNNKFVAVGDGLEIFTSSDGEIWDAHTPVAASTQQFFGVAYGAASGGNLYVAVGGQLPAMGMSDAPGLLWTSSDGVTWTDRTSALPSNAHILNGIAYGNGLFAAVGKAGVIYTSSDGTTWTLPVNDDYSTYHYDLSSVSYGPGATIASGLVAPGFVAAGKNRIIVVSNLAGTQWGTAQFTSPSSFDLTGIINGRGIFVEVGYGVIVSPYTITYTTPASPRLFRFLPASVSAAINL